MTASVQQITTVLRVIFLQSKLNIHTLH